VWGEGGAALRAARSHATRAGTLDRSRDLERADRARHDRDMTAETFRPWKFADAPKGSRTLVVTPLVRRLGRSVELAERHKHACAYPAIDARPSQLALAAQARVRFKANLDQAETTRAALALLAPGSVWPRLDDRLTALRAVRAELGL